MIELETIKGILENNGVECSVRTKRFKDPSLDYNYILCYMDNRYFETSVPCDNTVRMVTYRGGLMYTLNRMFSEFELEELGDDMTRYAIVWMVDELYRATL